MEIATINGQSIDDFFRYKIPQALMTPLGIKIGFLKLYGRDCIGSFVFPFEDIFHFKVSNPHMSEYAEIYISFIDVRNIILIVNAETVHI